MKSKALLVGINKYPDPDNNLNGCINDIQDMGLFLRDKKDFKMEDIRLLTDKRATKKNIVERLEWLIDDVKAGDRIVFHYSAHGAQMATRSHKGEIDGLDEVICPYDFDWTDSTAIKDKDFSKIFSKVPAGVEFIWVSDSCHSADLSKGFVKPQKGRHKSMVAPADIAWRNMTSEKLKTKLSAINKSTKVGNLALISGCKSNQESSDAVFNKRSNGALTYFLLNTLKTNSNLHLDKLVLTVREKLKKNKYEQEPQVEGSSVIIKKPFL